MFINFKSRIVRESLARELKKASWYGGGLIAVTGFTLNRVVSFLLTIFVWVGLQTIAHWILGTVDENDKGAG